MDYNKRPYFWHRKKKEKARWPASVRMPVPGNVTINDRDIDDYFRSGDSEAYRPSASEPDRTDEKFDIVCRVSGGGVTGQAGAIRHIPARFCSPILKACVPALKKRPGS